MAWLDARTEPDSRTEIRQTTATLRSAVRTYRAGEPPPRAWSMPDPPGPEVTAVRTALDRRYERCGDGYWRVPGQNVLWTWRQLLIIGPLTDATQTATAPAVAAQDGPGADRGGSGSEALSGLSWAEARAFTEGQLLAAEARRDALADREAAEADRTAPAQAAQDGPGADGGTSGHSGRPRVHPGPAQPRDPHATGCLGDHGHDEDDA